MSRRPAVRIFAVEKELAKDDPGQQVVDAVVVEALLLQSLANVLQPLKQQAVGPSVTAKAIGKLPVEIARRQPHPV